MLDKEKIRKDAEYYLIEGAYERAIEELGKLCVIDTGDTWVWNSLAECYLNTGDERNAVKNFLVTAKKFAKQGDLHSALSTLDRIKEIDQSNKEYQEERNRIAERLSKEESKSMEKVSKRIQIFSELEEKELREMLEIARPRNFKQGDIVIKDGDKGDSIYFIISGNVNVLKNSKTGKDIVVDTLSDGDFFGEFGFFTGGRRMATISASTDVELYEFTKEEMESISKKYENIAKVLIGFYKKRILDSIIAITPIFNGLSSHDREDIINMFELVIVEAGVTVIKEGEIGDAMYVVKDGELEVSTADKNGRQTILAHLGEGDVFGEVSVITAKPRTATVKTVKKSRLMKLKKEDFQRIVDIHPSVKSMALQLINERAEDTIKHILTPDKGRLVGG